MKFPILLAASCMAGALFSEASFKGETSRFLDSCYKFGEVPQAVFEGEGWQAGEAVRLEFEVKDPYGSVIKKWTSEVAAQADGKWKCDATFPNDRLGAFRVYVKANGKELPDAGTRGAGYLTYAVLTDPKSRPFISDEDAFLGLHGGRPWQAPWIGAHWRLDYTNDRWPNGEEESWEKRKRHIEEEGGWQSYYFITASRIFQRKAFYSEEALEYFGKKIPMIGGQIATEKGAKYCIEAISKLAKAASGSENLGMKQRIYEIFWEPELHYDSTETIMRAAKLVYPAIKAADPDAIVAAPSPYTINSYDRFKDYFERGLADYMDAVAIHPYGHVEKDDFRGKIRALKRLVRDYKGRDLPIYGTESGCGATITPESELMQAETWVRTLLTLLGEGFRFHHLFYGFDWGSDRNNVVKGGTGLAYNLDYPRRRWAPVHMSPKPSMAAVSAFSLFVDGCRPTCVIDDLGGSCIGYAYSDKTEERCVLALWDYNGQSEVEIVSGCETTRLGDLMGNVREVASPGGKLRLKLSSSTVYVLNANKSLWGRSGSIAKVLRAKVREVADPLKIKRVEPIFKDGVPGVKVEVSNEGEKELRVAVETRIRGVPEARHSKTVAVSPRSSATVDFEYEGFGGDNLNFFRQQIKIAAGQFRSEWAGAVNFMAAPCLDGRKMGPLDGKRYSFAWDSAGVRMRFLSDLPRTEIKFARQALPQRTPNGFADIMNEAVQTLAFTAEGVERIKTFNKTRFPLGAVKAIKSGAAKRENGLEFRAFIPWSELGFTDKPKQGDSFRISAPGMFASEDDNPKSFGIVTLTD